MTAPLSIMETLEAALDFIGIYTEPKHPRAVVSLKLQATIAAVRVRSDEIAARMGAEFVPHDYDAQRIEARSDETRNGVRPEGREPDGEADAPKTSPTPSNPQGHRGERPS